MLDSLHAHIAILDEEGHIIHVNKARQDFSTRYGLNNVNYGMGSNYLTVYDNAACYSQDVLRQSEDFYDGMACHSLNESRWFVVRKCPVDCVAPECDRYEEHTTGIGSQQTLVGSDPR